MFGFQGVCQSQNVHENTTDFTIENQHRTRKFDRFRSHSKKRAIKFEIGRHHKRNICPISERKLTSNSHKYDKAWEVFARNR